MSRGRREEGGREGGERGELQHGLFLEDEQSFSQIRNLEKAIRDSGVEVNVTWMPFFLDPTTPSEGKDLLEYLIATYGQAAAARFDAPDNPLDQAGRKVGITFDKTRRIINTLDCHRLMEWCNRQFPDKADSLMEKMFHAYFEEARDLSVRENLIDVSLEAGLERPAVEEVVNSDTFHQEVLQADIEGKRRYRVSGVPFFIVEPADGSRPTAFSGAQPPDIIAEILLEARNA